MQQGGDGGLGRPGPDAAWAQELYPAMWPMTSIPVLGFPAVTVPARLEDGLPYGVQLVGGRFEEDLVLDAAQAVEDRAALPPLWA
ncbi:hypothetical protein [Streptomyces sp. NPDC005827]|uniref:hypothetical protein n=1 Tax=Streptomyces sp. NPDC005827 TaxID=3157070 RepID=UPI0033C5D009